MMVPGVTSRTTSRFTTDFAPRFLRFRRVLGLLADGDAVAKRDQAVEIVVGALDRHAAHADVLALVLAALGQHDAERPARDFRVVEEQLVEIAHPVEQQAVRIGGLDLEILRHHRREARGGVAVRAVAGGVHRLEPNKSRAAPQGGRRDIHGRSGSDGQAARAAPAAMRRAFIAFAAIV